MAIPWKDVANALADRMQHHAHCEDHPEAAAVPDRCPFCADRAAYRMWETKTKQRHVDPDADAPLIDIHTAFRNQP